MQILKQQQPESLGRAIARRSDCVAACHRVAPLAAAAWVSAQLLLGFAVAAQTTAAPAKATQATHSTAHPIVRAASPVRTHHKQSAVKPATPPALAQATVPPPPVPAAPPLPNWPVNDKPVEATVVWDSQGLLIQAANASLQQILNDVSLKTGAKVEGMGGDERIFGTYGPGPARDVLAQLLDGSGYNILMVGDQGAGTPRRIVLSGRPTGTASPQNGNPASASDNEPENEQEVEQPNPVQPPMPGAAPGMPARTPQQMQLLMEERQRQMQQPQVPQN